MTTINQKPSYENVPDPQQDKSRALLEKFELARLDYREEPQDLVPRYCLDGVPIATPGNISVITAHPGAGKTGLIGAMLAASMVAEGVECDTMGITSCNVGGQAVVYLDTEQFKNDSLKVLKRVLRRAKISEPPYWFRAYHLRKERREDVQRWIPLFLKQVSEDCDGIHSILIDGFAELVDDVNDQRESIDTVQMFMNWADEYFCHFGGVLHLNPGSDKSRGHFGSELTRRCETELSLKRKGDGPTIIVQTKARHQWISGQPTFEWSEKAGMHVRLEAKTEPKADRTVETARSEAAEAFGTHPALKFSELVASIVATSGGKRKEGTAKNLVARWKEMGVVRSAGVGGMYQLVKRHTDIPVPRPEAVDGCSSEEGVIHIQSLPL